MASVTLPQHDNNYVTIAPQSAKELMSDINQDQLAGLYQQYGAILLSGFTMNLDYFNALTERFCRGSVTNESGGREVVDVESNVQTVNLGSDWFPLHPEISREPWKPDICLFGCVQPPSVGGETILCDGVEVVKHLPKELTERLLSERLLYQVPTTPEELKYWLGTTEPNDQLLLNPPKHCPFKFQRVRQANVITREFTAPFLHTPMYSKAPAFGNFLLFSWYYINQRSYPVMASTGQGVDEEIMATIKEVSDKLTVAVPWRAGDVLILDNTRFMHGRNAIQNAKERLILSYFGYLKSPTLTPEQYPNAPWRTGKDSEFVNRTL
jgi:alpha-ketoglutarate-dependent taurine dioxygenase